MQVPRSSVISSQRRKKLLYHKVLKYWTLWFVFNLSFLPLDEIQKPPSVKRICAEKSRGLDEGESKWRTLNMPQMKWYDTATSCTASQTHAYSPSSKEKKIDEDWKWNTYREIPWRMSLSIKNRHVYIPHSFPVPRRVWFKKIPVCGLRDTSCAIFDRCCGALYKAEAESTAAQIRGSRCQQMQAASFTIRKSSWY